MPPCSLRELSENLLVLEAGKQEELQQKVEECPGCKCAHLQEPGAPLPKQLMFVVSSLVLCNSLPVQILYPYMYFMVEDFHVDKRRIGTYAGLLASSILVGRTLTAIPWGVIGDKYGRKPVILCGMISLVVFNTLFGLSKSIWMALVSRFLLGALNGLHGLLPAYSAEICSQEHLAFTLSLLSTMWSVGSIIGPAIGGYLSKPPVFLGEIFSERYPYLLPPLVVSLFGLVLTLFLCTLPETIHNHERYKSVSKDGSGESILRNCSFWSVNTLYCIWTFHDIAYDETFSLWAVSPSGLGWSSQDVGAVLAVTGGALLLFLLLVYPCLARRVRQLFIARTSAILTLPVLATYPFLPRIGSHMIVAMITILKTCLSGLTTASLFFMVNNSLTQEQRGTANGVASCLVSLARAFGPSVGGVVFSWAQTRGHAFDIFPGNEFLFFFLAAIVVVVIIGTFILPRSINKL